MSDELVAGMLVGRYRLLFRLGKGGMGEVWAATQSVSQLGFQKLIALKVLRTKEMTSNAAVMFLDEARAASALEHAAIVPTVDLGRDGDVLFLAMDMVRGPSLTALLQRLVINKGEMSPAIVAHIGIQIASALDYAHERATFEGKALRLIHRDVSPHNMLLDLNGAVRLTDFGVARTTIQNHESHVGTVRGKPSYMAPEQVVGGDIDARTDVFSLGIVLYESASLKRLFGRSNPVKSMDAVLKHQPRSLLDLVPGFPPSLWNIIRRALEKDPEKRFQRAADLAEALSEESRNLAGASRAPRDLCTLIRDNFPGDAFEIDGRVREALAHADAAILPPSAPSDDSIRVTAGPADATRAVRPRSHTRRPSSNGVAVSAVRGDVTAYVSDAYATQAWPTASAPDPLAPEAIEEARTQFAARTPSGIQSLNMAISPAATPSDALPPLTNVTTGASFVRMARPERQGHLLVIAALVAAAVFLLGAAFFVVTSRRETVIAPVEANEVTQARTSTQSEARAVRATPKPQERTIEPTAPVNTRPAEATATPEEAREAAPPKKTIPKRATPTAASGAPAEDTESKGKPQQQATADGNATRAEVLELIRRVKRVDPEAAKEMYPTLNEAGEDNVKVLNELRTRARTILASH